MPGQPQTSPARSQPARRPRRDAGSQGGPGEARRRDVARPLPDPVAIRLCRVPDTAPPYDDEVSRDPGSGRADALAATIVAALDRGDRPARAEAVQPAAGPRAGRRQKRPRRRRRPTPQAARVLPGSAGPPGGQHPQAEQHFRAARRHRAEGTPRQGDAQEGKHPQAAQHPPGRAPPGGEHPQAGRQPQAGRHRQAVTRASGLAQQVRAGAGRDARRIPAAGPDSPLDDRTRPVSHTQARAAAHGRTAAAGPAGHHLAPSAGVVEMSVVVGFGPRVRALAVRLERTPPRPAAAGQPARQARWLCTAVEAA